MILVMVVVVCKPGLDVKRVMLADAPGYASRHATAATTAAPASGAARPAPLAGVLAAGVADAPDSAAPLGYPSAVALGRATEESKSMEREMDDDCGTAAVFMMSEPVSTSAAPGDEACAPDVAEAASASGARAGSARSVCASLPRTRTRMAVLEVVDRESRAARKEDAQTILYLGVQQAAAP